MGPAAWHHGWRRDDWDALAGAVVAGHVIECGAQATGGNYSFFTEVPGLEHPGFPIAEVAADGSSVITKHPGHGGQVSIGTVTAQLLYEIGGPAYLDPDVTARFDTIRSQRTGRTGCGSPACGETRRRPPPRWRSTIRAGSVRPLTLYLTGLDIEEKAALVERACGGIPGGRESFASVDVSLLRTDRPDPTTNEGALAELRITVKDPDERRVGRAFTSKVTELALASYPGLSGTVCQGASAYGVYWPAVVPASMVSQEVVIGSERSDCRSAGAAPVAAGVAGRRRPAPRRHRRSAGPPAGHRPYGRRSGASSGRDRETRAEMPTSGCGSVPTPPSPGWPGS